MSFTTVAAHFHANEFDTALAELQRLHREWHDRPREHTVIHFWQIRIALRQARYRRAAWEVVAMVFAAPTSLVQKYLGLVRKGI